MTGVFFGSMTGLRARPPDKLFDKRPSKGGGRPPNQTEATAANVVNKIKMTAGSFHPTWLMKDR